MIFNCPRERYYYTEYGGRGIQSSIINDDLLFGLAVHKGCEILSGGGGFDEAVSYALEEMKDMQEASTPEHLSHIDEMKTLLYGELKMYEAYILPLILNEYEIIGTEEEIVIPLSPEVTYLTRLDKKLRRRSDDVFLSLNYKTSSYLSNLYDMSEHNLQLIMEAKGASISTGSFVSGSLVVGFDKGSKRKVSDSEQRQGLEGSRRISPFTYGYSKDDDPWESDKVSSQYKAGWKRFPIWGGGNWIDMAEEWWGRIEDRVKMSQFVILPPIIYDPSTIESLSNQIVQTELELPKLRYPQNLKNCNQHAGYIGHKCPYIPFCWNGERVEDVLGGAFRWREINHEYEREFLPEEVRWL
jgi:hypothetical protein